MKRKLKAREQQALINRALGIIRQLWLKGIPLKVGEFQFKTAKKQKLVKNKLSNKFASKYYIITFDRNDMVVRNPQTISANLIKKYNLNSEELDKLKPKIHNARTNRKN